MAEQTPTLAELWDLVNRLKDQLSSLAGGAGSQEPSPETNTAGTVPSAEGAELRLDWMKTDLDRALYRMQLEIDELKKRTRQPSTSGGGGGSSDSCATDSPTSIGSAAEGSEAANTTTWAGSVALTLYAMTRVAYYDAGDETLYGYFRALTFDSCGKLQSVGVETRVTIDVPEA